MDISSLMGLSSITNSTLSSLNSSNTDSETMSRLASLTNLSSAELEELSNLSTTGLSTVTGISNDALKTATESFSTVLKNTLEEVQETGTLSEETQEQISEVVNVLQSAKTDTSDDSTAYELYKELFSSAQGRKNVQEIVQAGFTGMIFDSDSVTTGLENMSAMISALENVTNNKSESEN